MRTIQLVRRLIVPALLTLSVASPAFGQSFADREGFYAQGFGGLSRLDTPSLTEGTIESPVYFGNGTLVGAAAGYDFGGFRFEGEVAYRDHEASSLATIAATTIPGRGEVSALTFMLNGYLDFDLGGAVAPYIGAGVGAARIDMFVTDNLFILMDDREWAFAAQAMAGVGALVTPDIELFIEARVMAIDASGLDNPANPNIPGPFSLPALSLADNYVSYDGLVGLRWHFGGATAAPSLPVSPEQETLPAGGDLTVRFEGRSDRLSVEAASVLDGAVVVYEATGRVRVTVVGEAVSATSASSEVDLAQRRATVVRQGLVDRGLPPEEIVVRRFGETEPLVPTPTGADGARGGRVDIVIM